MRSKAFSYSKFVLLVDDDPADLMLFRRWLEKADFRVMATTQTDAAVAAIVEGQVGCLVTDQKMPVPGQELISYLQTVRSDIGLILLSGSDTPPDHLPVGTTFIHKDQRQKLLDTVAHCMSRYKAA